MSRSNVDELTVGSIDQTFLLTDAEIHETKNGDPYLRATLQDKTGTLGLVQWETDQPPGDGLYRVRGMVEEYRGQLQVKASDLSPAEGDVEGFVPSSHLGSAYLSEQLSEALDQLGGEIGQVVTCIFSDDRLRDRFLSAPAATRNHHAYRGGLAEHTLSMARLARRVSDHYQAFYPEDDIDEDLLVAGVLLHDLAKTTELEQDGLTWQYSIEGELVGHIAECVTLISEAATACLASEATRRRLIHMVAAHHGQKDYGSPVEPKLLEAEILHHIDMIDSRASMFREADQGEWVKPLGRRVFP